MTEVIIIRPPEVWDTRSPLIRLNRQTQQLGQAYWSTVLALSSVRYVSKRMPQSAHAASIFGHGENGPFRYIWDQFIRSFPSDFDGSRPPVNVKHFRKSANAALAAITEHAIVKSSSNFEAFAQCWALNYLLARLETPHQLTDRECALARDFSSKHIPGWPRIVAALPILQTELSVIAHVRVDPRTGKMTDAPITEQLNALVVISFWRQWRNALVHHSGVIGAKFLQAHAPTWAALAAIAPAPRLSVDAPLPLTESVYRSVGSVHAHAARRMKAILMDASRDRRGHVLAPGPRWPTDRLPPDKLPPRLPAMLMSGDHEPSLAHATTAA